MQYSFNDSAASVHQVGSFNRHAAPANEDKSLLKLTYSPVAVGRGAEHVRYGIDGSPRLAGKDFFSPEMALAARGIANQLDRLPKGDSKLEAELAKLLG